METKEHLQSKVEYLEARIEFLRSRLNEEVSKSCQYFCALPECAKQLADKHCDSF